MHVWLFVCVFALQTQIIYIDMQYVFLSLPFLIFPLSVSLSLSLFLSLQVPESVTRDYKSIFPVRQMRSAVGSFDAVLLLLLLLLPFCIGVLWLVAQIHVECMQRISTAVISALTKVTQSQNGMVKRLYPTTLGHFLSSNLCA